MNDVEEKEYPQTESRNRLQATAMTAVYDALTYISMGRKVDVEGIVSSLCDKPYEDCDYFVKAVLIYAIKYRQEAVDAFQKNMPHWQFGRLNRVTQAILLQAYVHYFYVEPDVDKAIVINIAVKHAKLYCDEQSKPHRFVNAILDKVLCR